MIIFIIPNSHISERSKESSSSTPSNFSQPSSNFSKTSSNFSNATQSSSTSKTSQVTMPTILQGHESRCAPQHCDDDDVTNHKVFMTSQKNEELDCSTYMSGVRPFEGIFIFYLSLCFCEKLKFMSSTNCR